MFGMGMGELIVIAIVALLFLGPEKLPDAAKTISKGIRDFRKQTRELQQIVEDDHEIGSAIRDLKSALRGEEPKTTAEERRRRAAEAARAAADNAAKAAEELAESADGPKTQRVAVDAAAGAVALPAADGLAADGLAGELSESDEPLLRPASGTVATASSGGRSALDSRPEAGAGAGGEAESQAAGEASEGGAKPGDEAHG